MYENNMKNTFQFTAWLLLMSNTYALNTFNASNNQLNIPSVNVGGLSYNNVVVTLGNVVSIGSSGQANTTAEGFWLGSTSNGFSLRTLALENNEFWSFVGMQSNGVYTVAGFDHGAFLMSGANGLNFFKEYYADNSSTLGYGTGTVIENTSINGFSYVGTSPVVRTTLAPINSSSYLYSKSPELADIAGTWTASSIAGVPTTININALGVLTGSMANCTFSGSLKERASGENVFDVMINNGMNCKASGLKQTGIAISYTNSYGKTQFVAAVVDETQKMGELFSAQR